MVSKAIDNFSHMPVVHPEVDEKTIKQIFATLEQVKKQNEGLNPVLRKQMLEEKVALYQANIEEIGHQLNDLRKGIASDKSLDELKDELALQAELLAGCKTTLERL